MRQGITWERYDNIKCITESLHRIMKCKMMMFLGTSSSLLLQYPLVLSSIFFKVSYHKYTRRTSEKHTYPKYGQLMEGKKKRREKSTTSLLSPRLDSTRWQSKLLFCYRKLLCISREDARCPGSVRLPHNVSKICYTDWLTNVKHEPSAVSRSRRAIGNACDNDEQQTERRRRPRARTRHASAKLQV
jgi:hypothetical protein